MTDPTSHGVRARIFGRLAALAAGGLDDDSCLYLLKEVVRREVASGRISSYDHCHMLRDTGGGPCRVVVEVLWDRGFRSEIMSCRKDWLFPEVFEVFEVMES